MGGVHVHVRQTSHTWGRSGARYFLWVHQMLNGPTWGACAFAGRHLPAGPGTSAKGFPGCTRCRMGSHGALARSQADICQLGLEPAQRDSPGAPDAAWAHMGHLRGRRPTSASCAWISAW